MTNESLRDVPESELIRQARSLTGTALESLLYSRSEPVLDALLENPALREPQLLLLLSRRDLPRRMITAIARNPSWMRSYAMKAALLKHPQTPRHLALPLLKHIYLFDLLSIAMTPGLAADLKRLAEDAVLAQLTGIALGQKLTLARRGTHRIAAGLLLDPDQQVISAALENPAMTDLGLAQALASERGPASLTQAVLRSARWMTRRPVQLALLRSKHLSLARFASMLTGLTAVELAELAQDPRLPRNLRDYVRKFSATRRRRPAQSTLQT